MFKLYLLRIPALMFLSRISCPSRCINNATKGGDYNLALLDISFRSLNHSVQVASNKRTFQLWKSAEAFLCRFYPPNFPFPFKYVASVLSDHIHTWHFQNYFLGWLLDGPGLVLQKIGRRWPILHRAFGILLWEKRRCIALRTRLFPCMI